MFYCRPQYDRRFDCPLEDNFSVKRNNVVSLQKWCPYANIERYKDDYCLIQKSDPIEEKNVFHWFQNYAKEKQLNENNACLVKFYWKIWNDLNHKQILPLNIFFIGIFILFAWLDLIGKPDLENLTQKVYNIKIIKYIEFFLRNCIVKILLYVRKIIINYF